MSHQYLWILAMPRRNSIMTQPFKQSWRRPRSEAGICSCRRSRIIAIAGHSSASNEEFVNETTRQGYLNNSQRPVCVLPLDVVQRIASGEVIIGFESVVQELVENAIDGQAAKVSVTIDFSSSSVTVADDGVGISAEQGMSLIAQCNATSKLQSVDELQEGVSTLGFRGQGLWAIAAKGKGLVVSSRTKDALHGTSIAFSRNGEPIPSSVSPVPMAVGTIVAVRELPWSLIGREQSKAVQRCKNWLVRTALCHPSISFELKRDKKLCWKSVHASDAKGETLLQSFAKELKKTPSDFRHGSTSLPGLGTVDVVIGLPSRVHMASRLWLITALNGRSVAMEALSRTITPLFSVPRGRFPVFLAHVKVSCKSVDWNISPMKANVRFKTSLVERRVKDAITGVLKDLMQGVSRFQTDTVADSDVGFPRFSSTFSSRKANVMQVFLSSMSSHWRQSKDDAKQDSFDKSEACEIPDLSKGLLFNARIVGQILSTYILVEHDGGILLVEQHVADERVLYERLLTEWRTSPFVQLRDPVQLPDSVNDEGAFSLTSLGFDIESVVRTEDRGVESTYFVRSVPRILSGLPPNAVGSLLVRLCSEAITVENAAASVACSLATKNGTFLRQKKMSAIVTDLMHCQNPHTCPHGRPVFVEFGTRDLARLFGRSWTPERLKASEPVEVHKLPLPSSGRSQGMLPE